MSEAVKKYLALYKKWAVAGYTYNLKTEKFLGEMDKVWQSLSEEEKDVVKKEINKLDNS